LNIQKQIVVTIAAKNARLSSARRGILLSEFVLCNKGRGARAGRTAL
jgi:hypothetical protein